MRKNDKLLYNSKKIMAAMLSLTIATSTMPQKVIEIKAETIDLEETKTDITESNSESEADISDIPKTEELESNSDSENETTSETSKTDELESDSNNESETSPIDELPSEVVKDNEQESSNQDLTELDSKFVKKVEFVVKRIFGDENGNFNSWDSKEEHLNNATIVITTPNEEEITLTTMYGNARIDIEYDKDNNENTIYTYKVYKQGYTTYEGTFDIKEYANSIEVNLSPIETKTIKVVLDGLEEANKVKVKLVPLSLNGTESETRQVLYDEENNKYYVEFASVYQTGSYNIVVESDKYSKVVKENINYTTLTNDILTTTKIALSKEKYKLVYKANELYDLHSYINLPCSKNDTTNEYEYSLIEYGNEILIKKIEGKHVKKVTLGGVDCSRYLTQTEEGLLLKVEPSNVETATLYIDIELEDLKISEIDIIATSDTISPAPNAQYTFSASVFPLDAYTNELVWDIIVDDKNADYTVSYSEDKKSATLTLNKARKGSVIVTVKDTYSGKISRKKYNIVKNVIDASNYIEVIGKKSEENSEWYVDAVTLKTIDDSKLFALTYPNGQIVRPTTQYVESVGGDRICYVYNKNFVFDITKLFNFSPVVGESQMNIKIDNVAPIFGEVEDVVKMTGQLIIGVKDYGTITNMEDGSSYYTQGSGIKSVVYAKCDENGNALEEMKEASLSGDNCIIDIPYEDYKGKYIVVATDHTNHTTTKFINVDTDVTKPTIDVMINNNLETKEYYNTNLQLDVLVKDNADIKQAYVEIIKDNSDKIVKEILTDTNEATLTEYITEDGKYNITVYVKDSHNNEATNNMKVVIDKKAPEIYVEYSKKGKEDGGITYYDELIDAKISITEEYFDEENTSVVIDGKETSLDWQHNGNEHTAIINFTKAKKYEFEVTSIDKAGNKNSKKVREELVIDLEGPDINVTYDNNDSQNEIYFSESRVATITITEDNLDIDSIEVIATSKNNEQVKVSNWTHNKNVHTAYIKFDKDGEYTLSINCKDKAGHKNSKPTSDSVAPWEFVIDTVAPEVKVSYNQDNFIKNNNGISYYNANTTATITIVEKNFDKSNVNITLTSSDVDGKSLALPTLTDFVSNGDVHTAYIYYNEESNYTFDIECIDKSGTGNKENNKKQLTVDMNAPTGLINAGQFGTFSGYNEDIYYGLWTSGDVSVNIFVQDNISGIESVEYIKTNKVMTKKELESLKESEWKEYAPFTQTKDERFVIYAKAVDKAGNVYYFNTNGIIIDKETPNIEKLSPIVTLQNPKNGIYNTDVVVDVSVIEKSVFGSYSGINYIAYKVIKDNVEITQSGELYVNDNKTPSEDELKQNYNGQIVIDSKLNNSNNVRLEVTAIDNAGNTITQSSEFKIDIVAPIINISYDNNDVVNGKYFKEDRTATITIYERNFDENDVVLNITSSSKAPAITEWTSYVDSANPDNTKHVAKIKYYESGDYTFDISYVDMANNEASKILLDNSISPKEFVIDKINPIIDIKYDNVAKNNEYYNKTRTATVTITEHNFNANDVNIMITSNNGTVKVPTFVSNGDKHTTNIVFEKDGIYTLEITYKDMANREANRIAKQQFVIDKTSPKVDIYGVEEKIAYNASVIAPIIKSSDTNFEKTIITLKDKTGKTISYSGNTSYEDTKQVYTFNNILDDGIYILSAITTDKAGNKTETEVEFSVNRRGSTYKFDDITQNVRKQYISEEKDLIIYEVNVSPLKKESIKVKLVKNGNVETLKENVDYEIIENTTKNGWYEYMYKVYRTNFTTEGTYSIILHSEDMADNVSENTLETKSAEVTFAVDKSKPICIVSGIKENTLYNTSKQKATLAISDNTRVKGIYVYVNGELYKSIDEDNNTQVLSAIYENGNMDIEFEDLAKKQNIQIRIIDVAGNEQNIEVNNVLVSTNIWVRFCNNKLLVMGSVVVGISVVAIIIAMIIRKRHLVLTEEKE